MTSPAVATWTLQEIAEALAAKLTTLDLAYDDELQVTSVMNPNPTPPALDVYLGDPFLEAGGFGPWEKQFWTVRARVTTADLDAGQRLLYRLVGPGGVADTLTADPTLGGIVDAVAVTDGGTSGLRAYAAVEGVGELVGVEWRVEVWPKGA